MNFCSDAGSLWYTVGMFMLVVKVVIPVLIIIFGMIDLGQAVISSDDKAVSKSAKTLLHRVIAGVCIFFVPTIIGIVFKMVGAFSTVKGEYDYCAACVSNPTGEKCDDIKKNS